MFKRGFAFLAVVGLAAGSQAFSFAGSDWSLAYDMTYHVNTSLGSGDIPEVATGLPINVVQADMDHFQFPYDFGAMTGTGDFVVSGTTVTDVNHGKTSNPFDVDLNGSTVTIRVTYSDWDLVGHVTGTNSGVTDGFGDRAFHVTGDPVTVSDVQIEALLNNNWVNLGSNSSVDINSWSMDRSPVPEPASLVALVGAGMVALRHRKKRS